MSRWTTALKGAALLWLLVLGGAVCAKTALQWGAATTCLDDAGVQRLLAESRHHPILLYVWSPRMVLSAEHAHEVAAVAADMGVQFVPVHDGRVPSTEIQEAVQAVPARAAIRPEQNVLVHSQPLCAPVLEQRDSYRHFPTAWVVQQGSFHPVPLVSAMPPQFWRMGLQQRLQQAGSSRQPIDATSSP